MRYQGLWIPLERLSFFECVPILVPLVLQRAPAVNGGVHLRRRYHTLRMLTEYAPFHLERKDSGINVAGVVERLWEIMK